MSTTLSHLRHRVQAACVECDTAMIFHATWRTAMDDHMLHDRLGVSYATNAFRSVVTALRREILMALLRIWDTSPDTINMPKIIADIGKAETIQMLAEARGTSIHKNMIILGGTGLSAEAITDNIRDTLDETAQEFLYLSAKYSQNAGGNGLLKRLRNLRNERLAHFSLTASAAPEKNASDQEVDEFFFDNAKMMQKLRSLVLGEAFDPVEAEEVHRHYAKLFWASVRGERSEGHPSYRPPTQD